MCVYIYIYMYTYNRERERCIYGRHHLTQPCEGSIGGRSAPIFDQAGTPLRTTATSREEPN